MASAKRLRAQSETLERQAAELAQAAATELMRPTSERAPIGGALDALSALHGQAALQVTNLRRLLGKEMRDAPRPKGPDLTDAQYARLLRTRLRLWSAVIEAAQDCDAGHVWPLLPDPRPRLDLGAAQEAALNAVFTRAHRALNPGPQAEAAAHLGCFPDIPLNAGWFLSNAHLACRLLRARKHAGPTRFLDVGCGGGVKVVLASELFDTADGLDIDQGYVETAGRTLAAMRATRCRVFQADGLTFDGYADYDVIYFYQPMSDQDGLMRLERRIAETAAPGAILIAPYAEFAARAGQLGCLRVAAGVFVTAIADAELGRLVAETRRIGPHAIVNPDQSVPDEAGWLRPLWLACEANGIRPY